MIYIILMVLKFIGICYLGFFISQILTLFILPIKGE